ncbi:hypothetical protein C2G38_2175095 [Gigaspora rosea]|uniref:Uncharacterized protein n=1 Tax=Gigaspora rosea TaxID=44941 RepID=A0A397VKY4_9GLOM|nr:hypothetical protein C2G38_2175095 [Gigaspora rosea]
MGGDYMRGQLYMLWIRNPLSGFQISKQLKSTSDLKNINHRRNYKDSTGIKKYKSINIWMDLLNKFCQLHGYLNDIKELDDKILSEQLEQFVVEVCKSNGQEYKASSLYTVDKNKFKSLHKTLDGQMKAIVEKGSDAKHLKASWLKELDNGGMQLELPKQKNHAGGIKDPYAEAGLSFILPKTYIYQWLI